MNTPNEAQLTDAPWRKSARSGGGQATCVEVTAIEMPSEGDQQR